MGAAARAGSRGKRARGRVWRGDAGVGKGKGAEGSRAAAHILVVRNARKRDTAEHECDEGEDGIDDTKDLWGACGGGGETIRDARRARRRRAFASPSRP